MAKVHLETDIAQPSEGEGFAARARNEVKIATKGAAQFAPHGVAQPGPHGGRRQLPAARQRITHKAGTTGLQRAVAARQRQQRQAPVQDCR
eukprot:4359787-Pyramimonas_sp.AAC.1